MKCVEEHFGGCNEKTYKITYFEDKLKKKYDIITIASID